MPVKTCKVFMKRFKIEYQLKGEQVDLYAEPMMNIIECIL